MSFILRANSIHDPDQSIEHLDRDAKTKVLLHSAAVNVYNREIFYSLKWWLVSISVQRLNKYSTARALFNLRLLQDYRTWANYNATSISDLWDIIVY